MKAAGFMLMGSTSMALMNIFSKLVKNETNIAVMQMGAFRFLIMAVGCFIHARCTGVELTKFPGNTRNWVFPRALFGYLSSMGQFISIFMLPLSIAVVLYFTQPITSSIITYFLLGEKMSWLQIISIVSSMIGVVFLCCPQVIIPSLRENDTVLAARAEEFPDFNKGVAFALCGSVSSGFAYFTMRKIGT